MAGTSLSTHLTGAAGSGCLDPVDKVGFLTSFELVDDSWETKWEKFLHPIGFNIQER